ncbi:membrane protein [Intrasporangium oryzae NRRL B-24470]|uniref:Membrane protein n=1 Tax=Intrasporangium oryzae NRRL B-24470 TaxID=1386089 RepID=W9GD43_9MICO|nr:NfeD family protein [Intrasporangium oryzae]EWT01784.1 membrane protein [Intrasporangium oryzae NRRL B-24470]
MFEGYAWLVWLGAALVLVAIEAATVDFTFLMLGGGALGGAVAAALGASFPIQAVVAAVVAVALLALVRPWLKRRLSVTEPHRMGTDANLGRAAFVLDRVTTSGGQIKLAGETWSARTLGESIEPGEEVIVDAIDGATAVVSRARVIGS